MRRQTYGYLPSRKASQPTGWYQIIVLGDRGTCVLTTCPGLHSIAERPGFELTTYWSQVQHSNHLTTEPHLTVTLPVNWQQHYIVPFSSCYGGLQVKIIPLSYRVAWQWTVLSIKQHGRCCRTNITVHNVSLSACWSWHVYKPQFCTFIISVTNIIIIISVYSRISCVHSVTHSTIQVSIRYYGSKIQINNKQEY